MHFDLDHAFDDFGAKLLVVAIALVVGATIGFVFSLLQERRRMKPKPVILHACAGAIGCDKALCGNGADGYVVHTWRSVDCAECLRLRSKKQVWMDAHLLLKSTRQENA